MQKVIESRSVEIGHQYRVPIYIASSLNDARGTIIEGDGIEVEQKSVTAVSVSEDVLMVSLKQLPYSPAKCC